MPRFMDVASKAGKTLYSSVGLALATRSDGHRQERKRCFQKERNPWPNVRGKRPVAKSSRDYVYGFGTAYFLESVLGQRKSGCLTAMKGKNKNHL